LTSFEDSKKGRYLFKHDRDPTWTIYWTAQTDRQRVLRTWNCPLCTTTVFDGWSGNVSTIINAPINLTGARYVFTVRCRYCRQNYRFVANDIY